MYLIQDLWRGDVPLMKTCYLFCGGVGILFRIAFAYIEYQSTLFSAGLGLVIALDLVVFAYTYSVFISFATWRSANNYQGLQRFAILAKIGVIFGVMTMIKEILQIFGILPPA